MYSSTVQVNIDGNQGVVTRWLPSGGSDEETIPCLLLSFWCLPAIISIPWLATIYIDWSLQSIPCLHMTSVFFCALWSSYKDSTQILYNFTLITFIQALILIKVTFSGTGKLRLEHIILESTVQLTTTAFKKFELHQYSILTHIYGI